MRLIISLILVGLIMLTTPYDVFAENWADAMGDILSGKENSYFWGEVVKAIDAPNVFLGIDRVEGGVYTKVETSHVNKDRDIRRLKQKIQA